MNRFHSALGEGETWRDAAAQCAASLGPASGANLAFVYLSDVCAAHAPEILHSLKQATDIEHWVGSVGMGVCATAAESYQRPAVSVLAGRFPHDEFRVFGPVHGDFSEFEIRHRDWCRGHRPYFGVVHADPRAPHVAGTVEELSRRMAGAWTGQGDAAVSGGRAPAGGLLETGFLTGGLSSSRGRYVQIADGIHEGGVSGVLFSPEVPVRTRLSQGCSPIGPAREITEATENIVVALDGRPALDALEEDLGAPVTEEPDRLADVHVALPIPGSDTGDYLVRNLVGLDPRHRLVAVGDRAPTGQLLRFCRRDADSAKRDLDRILGELRGQRNTAPAGGLYCSCVARGENLFGPDSEELRAVERGLGGFPLAGFFANGEISHNRLYGYTGVLTLFE